MGREAELSLIPRPEAGDESYAVTLHGDGAIVSHVDQQMAGFSTAVLTAVPCAEGGLDRLLRSAYNDPGSPTLRIDQRDSSASWHRGDKG